jgi:hypothetical protein
VLLGAVVLAVGVGLAVWSLTHTASYQGSRAGCVNVVVPSTTGGGILHECGAAARGWCTTEFTRHDALARLAAPQCERAGYRPKRSR